MSKVNPNYNPFSDWKEPNEALKKAAEKYKEKYKEEYHPDSAYGQWMKRMNGER